ncbi:MAG: hypothetical protein ACQKBU_01865 [Verrucomicrobiales bacterium]
MVALNPAYDPDDTDERAKNREIRGHPWIQSDKWLTVFDFIRVV